MPNLVLPEGTLKVGIVGFAGSRVQAPYQDQDWFLCGINDVYAHVPRIDMTFELHQTDVLMQQGRRNPQYIDWLSKGKQPIWMVDPRPEFPSAQRFPFEALRSLFPREYWTNSVAWTMAACLIDLTDTVDLGDGRAIRVAKPGAMVGLWGIHMAAACVEPETRVLTEDLKWVPAWRVQVGDRLIAFDEENPGDGHRSRRWRVATVEQADEIVEPSYRMLMADGTKMVASAEHRWLTRGAHEYNWRLQKRVQSEANFGPRSTKIMKLIEPWDSDRSWGAGYIAAALDGEGSLSQSPTKHTQTHTAVLSFAQRDNEMATQFEAEMGLRGIKFGKVPARGVTQYNISGGRAEIMRVLGLYRPPRLLNKFDPSKLGHIRAHSNVPVLENEFVGDQTVIALKTDTGTFIAEGFASHNSEYQDQRRCCEYIIGLMDACQLPCIIPPDSELMKAGAIYGLDTTEPLRRNLDHKIAECVQAGQGIDQQIALKQQELQALAQQRASITGQKEAYKALRNNWTMPTDLVPTAEEREARHAAPVVPMSDHQPASATEVQTVPMTVQVSPA